MSVHIRSGQGSRAIGSHMPLNVALAVLPTLPRPLLSRLVANAIDLLDRQDGDADLEPEVTEQDDEPEIDDPGEDDDPGGGNVDDEGENAESEDSGHVGNYLTDQRTLSWRYGTHRID